jgi:hypothetical protein
VSPTAGRWVDDDADDEVDDADGVVGADPVPPPALVRAAAAYHHVLLLSEL